MVVNCRIMTYIHTTYTHIHTYIHAIYDLVGAIGSHWARESFGLRPPEGFSRAVIMEQRASGHIIGEACKEPQEPVNHGDAPPSPEEGDAAAGRRVVWGPKVFEASIEAGFASVFEEFRAARARLDATRGCGGASEPVNHGDGVHAADAGGADVAAGQGGGAAGAAVNATDPWSREKEGAWQNFEEKANEEEKKRSDETRTRSRSPVSLGKRSGSGKYSVKEILEKKTSLPLVHFKTVQDFLKEYANETNKNFIGAKYTMYGRDGCVLTLYDFETNEDLFTERFM